MDKDISLIFMKNPGQQPVFKDLFSDLFKILNKTYPQYGENNIQHLIQIIIDNLKGEFYNIFFYSHAQILRYYFVRLYIYENKFKLIQEIQNKKQRFQQFCLDKDIEHSMQQGNYQPQQLQRSIKNRVQKYENEFYFQEDFKDFKASQSNPKTLKQLEMFYLPKYQEAKHIVNKLLGYILIVIDELIGENGISFMELEELMTNYNFDFEEMQKLKKNEQMEKIAQKNVIYIKSFITIYYDKQQQIKSVEDNENSNQIYFKE